jgi:hypothetical protein
MAKVQAGLVKLWHSNSVHNDLALLNTIARPVDYELTKSDIIVRFPDLLGPRENTFEEAIAKALSRHFPDLSGTSRCNMRRTISNSCSTSTVISYRDQDK